MSPRETGLACERTEHKLRGLGKCRAVKGVESIRRDP